MLYNICMTSDERFPIRTLASLTGMKPVTLRAWERRYGFLKPLRTPTGRRLYTREHVELIDRVQALLQGGMEVGQVARSLQPPRKGEPAGRDTWHSVRRRMLGAIARFDEAGLEEAYEEALSRHSLERVTRRLLMPLLEELGARWESSEGSVAEEHFFSLYLRNKLGARFHHRRALAAGPKLVIACVPGEFHELGALLLALAAHDAGLRAVLLGANTPVGELPLVCQRAGCDALVLSSSVDPPAEFLSAELAALVRRTGRPVFLGGATSIRHRDRVTASGATPLGSDIVSGVRRIAAELGPNTVNRASD
jgi:MerR family transcriptional regulator, light-induced transcriptional regulator